MDVTYNNEEAELLRVKSNLKIKFNDVYLDILMVLRSNIENDEEYEKKKDELKSTFFVNAFKEIDDSKTIIEAVEAYDNNFEKMHSRKLLNILYNNVENNIENSTIIDADEFIYGSGDNKFGAYNDTNNDLLFRW